jgi:hypothetical protein
MKTPKKGLGWPYKKDMYLGEVKFAAGPIKVVAGGWGCCLGTVRFTFMAFSKVGINKNSNNHPPPLLRLVMLFAIFLAGGVFRLVLVFFHLRSSILVLP